MIDKVKTHLKKHKEAYVVGGIGFAAITCLIMRDNSSIWRRSDSMPAQSGISILGKNLTIKDTTLNNVSYISSDRQGPPSWVIRCLETGNVFTSQNAAALEMGIHRADLSKHLNGILDEAGGFHFERLCMAA